MVRSASGFEQIVSLRAGKLPSIGSPEVETYGIGAQPDFIDSVFRNDSRP